MARVDEARFDTRSDLCPLVVLDWTNERFEIADIRFFEERLQQRLVLTSAFGVLAFQIRFLQHERVFEDQRGNIESWLRCINGTFVSFASQNRKAPNVIEMAMRQQHCIEVTAFQLCRTSVLGFFLTAALEHPAIDQDARVFRGHVISRTGDIASGAVKLNLHQVSLKQQLAQSDRNQNRSCERDQSRPHETVVQKIFPNPGGARLIERNRRQ